jgi:hypothetical protein
MTHSQDERSWLSVDSAQSSVRIRPAGSESVTSAISATMLEKREPCAERKQPLNGVATCNGAVATVSAAGGTAGEPTGMAFA